jgi:hypothetical protein
LLVDNKLVNLIEQQVLLERSLDLSGKLDTSHNQSGATRHEGRVLQHMVTVFQVVRVHECNPLHEPHVIVVYIRRKYALVLGALLLQEDINIGWLQLDLFLVGQRTHCAKEITWVQFEIVVQHKNRAVCLKRPNRLEQLGVFFFGEKFSEN